MSDALAARLRAAGCVFAEEEAELLQAAAAGDALRLEALVARRCAGEPLEQVVGRARFDAIEVVLRAGVFVPRPRSEALVHAALVHCPLDAPTVVDLCCGSGALGLAFLHHRPAARLHAADIDPVAVACARDNVATRGEVHRGDLFAALPRELRGHVDVLLANVPYVPSAELPLLPAEARDHEPRHALDGGGDGLELLRRVAASACEWLAPAGSVLHEVADDQVDPARAALADAGLDDRVVYDHDRDACVVIGMRNRPFVDR